MCFSLLRLGWNVWDITKHERDFLLEDDVSIGESD